MEKTIVTCGKERLDISKVVDFIKDGFGDDVDTIIDNAIFGYIKAEVEEDCVGTKFFDGITALRMLRDAFRNIKVVHDDE